MNQLIQSLLARGVISEEQIREARIKQLGAKVALQELLVEMGFLSEEDLLGVAAEVLRMPAVDLDKGSIDPEAAKTISYELVKRFGVFPVRREGDTLFLAMSDPTDIVALDFLRGATGLTLKPLLAARSSIERVIEEYYQADEILYNVLKNVVAADVGDGTLDPRASFDVGTRKPGNAPIITFINRIFSDAVKARASDIHIEPQEDVFKVRYRIDGDLKEIINIPRKLLNPFVARFKVMSNLDLAETRKSQDGRLSIHMAGRKIDIRISVIPTYYGERVVLRILDPVEAKTQLDRIGLAPAELEVIKEICSMPQGMVLVTGPTGSGKTSTLYAALEHIKSSKKNIITIEDPVEYVIEGVNQIQVNPVKDVTFAMGLRSILRQDPNVILVGEIRDRETADIAFRASLTGHLVFSTLHTNSAVASITRLVDIGLEPYLLSSSLILIVAQRLLKINCQACRQEYVPAPEVRERLAPYLASSHIGKFVRGKGCLKCNFSGYFGRSAVFELLRISEQTKALIAQKASEEALLRAARESGMRLLVESAMERVADGRTTLEEVLRVVDAAREVPLFHTTTESSSGTDRPRPERPVVLVVDDEENIRRIIENRLKSAGFDVIQAQNGREGVTRAMQEKPDLIIMDVMMPEMDGFEATRILKSQLETAAIPLMMLTANKDPEGEVKGIDLGADDYMGKPFDGTRLIARVKMLLRRRPA